jgi:acetoacetate decarboxylase
MKRLLDLLGGGREIILRAGDNYNEFIIRVVQHIDDSNKVCAEVKILLDDIYPEGMIWRMARDELWHKILFQEAKFYEQELNKLYKGGDADGD